jgi:glycosyltransferase involved in cell wall biosynthesis
MKYLVAVNRLFNENPSGSARVAWDIACLARDAGHNVVLVCQSAKVAAGTSAKSSEYGMTVIRIGLSVSAFAQLQCFRKAVASALNAHLNGFQPDTIHIHSLLIGDAIRHALGSEQNYVCTIHSPVVPESRLNWEAQGLRGRAKILLGGLDWVKRIQNQTLTHSQRIHVLSEYTRSEIGNYTSKLPPVYVIPHWRRPELRRTVTKKQAREALKWHTSEPTLFSLRRMVPRMGHATAIRAIAPLLEKYKARLVLAGDGPLRGSLQSLASSQPGGDRIDFPGRISDDHMRLMYSGADLFVLPTAALECFGLIIIEALSYGCPVLATDVGAISETVGPLMPDFLIEPGNLLQLRERTEAFLAGHAAPPDALEILAYIEANYGVDKIGPRILRFIESV